jgi:hypothetical protein
MDHDARAREWLHAAKDGHGLWFSPTSYRNLLSSLAADLRRVEHEARTSERERCAKVAEDDYTQCSPSDVAAAIRALGEGA